MDLESQVSEQAGTKKARFSVDLEMPPIIKAKIKMLVKADAPPVLIALCILLAYTSPLTAPWLCMLEVFAGQHEVTKAFRRRGRRSIAFEKLLDDKYMDVMTSIGFSHWVHLGLHMEKGGMAMNAPVCSTWVFFSRNSTGRSQERPMGNRSQACVSEANTMVSRLVLAMYLYTAFGMFWIVEQPAGSLLEDHVRFSEFCSKHVVYRAKVRMGEFGGPTEKPTWLYSGSPCIKHINNYRIREWKKGMAAHSLTTVTVNDDGKRCTTGNKQLKQSQAYPRGFGEADCVNQSTKSYRHLNNSLLH